MLSTPQNLDTSAAPKDTPKGSRVGLSEWPCAGQASAWREDYESEVLIELPVLGLDLRNIRGRQLVVDPGVVVLHAAAESYRVTSPTNRPRRSTSLTLSPALADELAPDFEPGALRSSATTALLHQQVRRLAWGSSGHPSQPGPAMASDPLAREELTLMLVESVVRDMRQQKGQAQQASRLSPAWRRLADDLQAQMALAFDQALTLEDLAQACGSSAFHASRVFRRVTGQSIHQHLNQLRLRAALARLGDMQGRLSELALDCGFSSHSHFSSAFKAAYSCTPAALLRQAGLRA